MWGVGLCCRITLVPALPKEQVGARLQRSCALSAAVRGAGGSLWGAGCRLGGVLRAWAKGVLPFRSGPRRAACAPLHSHGQLGHIGTVPLLSGDSSVLFCLQLVGSVGCQGGTLA